MILVDTSVWVDHLRSGDQSMSQLLRNGEVLMHPFVLGEIAVGNLDPRREILHMLSNLPSAEVAKDDEVHAFLEHHALFGRGIGFIDIHLLASVQLTPHARFWTRDKRLQAAAATLGQH